MLVHHSGSRGHCFTQTSELHSVPLRQFSLTLHDFSAEYLGTVDIEERKEGNSREMIKNQFGDP